MQEENNTAPVEETNNSQEPQDERVPKKAYVEVSDSMHKYKNELKDAKARLAQLEADKQAAENEKLAEQGRWEDLYKQSQAQLDEAKAGRQAEQDKFINYHKKNSVISKLGGFKNDQYNSFIDVEAIGLKEDGSIDEDSLSQEVNRIKQSYPELLKTASVGKLPNEAPKPGNIGERDFKDLTPAEKQKYTRELLKKPQGY